MKKENVSEDNYVPYGDEWEKEVNKLPKKFLIDMLRKANMAKQKAEQKIKDAMAVIPDEPSNDPGQVIFEIENILSGR